MNENNVPPHADPVPEKKEGFWDLVKFALLALLIVIPVRAFIAQPFIVSGDSMVPTFHTSEYLVIDEISYRFKKPERGDVIVLRYPRDPKTFFIKRIVGMPGETVSLKSGKVFIKNSENPGGFELPEAYVKNRSGETEDYKVGEDEYFVMGDNRTASFDSRGWGPLNEKMIVGRAILRLLPLKQVGIYPGDYSN